MTPRQIIPGVLPLALFFFLGTPPALRADEGGTSNPQWLSKIPDFRAECPAPLPVGTPGPDFALKDASTGKRVGLAEVRKGKKGTLLLFIDENCGECKRRKGDLAAALAGALNVEGAAAVAVFPMNGVKSGEKGAKEFAAQAGFPASVPILLDQEGKRSETYLAYRVPITPCAAVLDHDGKLAYFGNAFGNAGGGHLPAVMEAVAAGHSLEIPPVQRPFG